MAPCRMPEGALAAALSSPLEEGCQSHGALQVLEDAFAVLHRLEACHVRLDDRNELQVRLPAGDTQSALHDIIPKLVPQQLSMVRVLNELPHDNLFPSPQAPRAQIQRFLNDVGRIFLAAELRKLALAALKDLVAGVHNASIKDVLHTFWLVGEQCPHQRGIMSGQASAEQGIMCIGGSHMCETYHVP